MEIALLSAEIEFTSERPAHFRYVGRGPIRREFRKLLCELRQAGEDFQIFVNLAHDTGVLHFNDDALAGFEPCAMNLANGSGGNRSYVKFGKQVIERLSQLGLHKLLNGLWRVS